ncbi:hypothetical protein GGR42_002643 [Saonia flava]|uniref:Gluconate 2-dehydrogenase subunit 3 n=1 Tax=Saonia flava TaxID=523696 RepID=A0A846QZR1_9FLAO|nr:gluconate 2-dehydrogenase subunit 3 family protein [Saonia flava]NJB72152.1 hypothetical protein [Saonia flava]
MNRKDFIQRAALLGGTAMVLPIGILQSCEYKPVLRTELTDADIPLLDEIGETIVPTTPESPGAKEAKIGAYMVVMINDCFLPEDQEIILNGINMLDTYCAKQYNSSFERLSSDEKFNVLQGLQEEATALALEQEGMDEPVVHYFDHLKGLTISGYFSSEIGMTIAREYVPIPGKYESVIPYKKGDKVWA